MKKLLLTMLVVLVPFSSFTINNNINIIDKNINKKITKLYTLKFSDANVIKAKKEIESDFNRLSKIRKFLAFTALGTASIVALYCYLKDSDTIKLTPEMRKNLISILQESKKKDEDSKPKAKSGWFNMPNLFSNIKTGAAGLGVASFWCVQQHLAGSIGSMIFSGIGLPSLFEKLNYSEDIIWFAKNRTSLNLSQFNNIDEDFISNKAFSILIEDFGKDNILNKQLDLYAAIALNDIEKVCGYILYKLNKAYRTDNIFNNSFKMHAKVIYSELKELSNILITSVENGAKNGKMDSSIFSVISEELGNLILSFHKHEAKAGI